VINVNVSGFSVQVSGTALPVSDTWKPETDKSGCNFISGKIEIIIRKRSTTLNGER
jgi:hypothetical protein